MKLAKEYQFGVEVLINWHRLYIDDLRCVYPGIGSKFFRKE
jgi:hypothetical protein